MENTKLFAFEFRLRPISDDPLQQFIALLHYQAFLDSLR